MLHEIHFKLAKQLPYVENTGAVGTIRVEIDPELLALAHAVFKDRSEAYIVNHIVGSIESTTGLHSVHQRVIESSEGNI